MNPSYRTVYFRPRLALDWRVPVAVMLSTKSGTRAVTAELLPDQECLGSAGARELLQFGVTELEQIKTGVMPASLGPHFEIGPQQPIPQGLEDPAKWLRTTALPTRQHHDETGEPLRKSRLPTLAWNHLSNWGVSGCVRKRFQPDKFREARALPPKIGAVTHFVVGGETILLLEPISLSVSAADERIADVFAKFCAYENAWDPHGERGHARIVYLLPGPDSQLSVAQATKQLKPVARVFNTADTDQRARFTNQVRKVAKTGPDRELV